MGIIKTLRSLARVVAVPALLLLVATAAQAQFEDSFGDPIEDPFDPLAAQQPNFPTPPTRPDFSTPPAATTTNNRKAGAVLNEKGLVNLDFTDVEIRDVVKAISAITGKNFVLDDRVRGKITIISPQPVTVKEAYEAFISALEVKNFTIYQEGKVVKIIPLRDAKSAAIPSGLAGEESMSAAYVTRLIPIKYINGNEIALSLKSLVSANGSLTAYGPTNSLIVTDSASNIRRLIQIIEKLDRPGFQEGIEVVPLTYASSPQVAQMLNELFQIKDEKKNVPARRARGSQDVEGGQVISKILPDERTNSLVVIANREGLEKVLNVVRRLDHEIATEEGKGRIHVHYLENADSEELAQTLSGLAGGGSKKAGKSKTTTPAVGGVPFPTDSMRSGGDSVSLFEGEVQITADAPTNSLVIRASPQDYEALKPVIQKLDIRRRQVFVEALIMEVNITRLGELGASLNTGAAFGSNNNPQAFAGTVFGGLASFADPKNLLNPSNASSLPSGAIFGLRSKSVDIGGVQIPIYGALFRALETDSVLNVLSTPNILTTDNKPAEILVGSNIPILSQTSLDAAGRAIQNFNRQDVGISLKVTPQVNESDSITLDIEQKIEDVNTDATSIASGTASINKRSAKTTVVVENEQTVVIGGLISDKENESRSKVPLLGDIPLLGWFFQNKSKTKSRTNLMIFITPTVVKGPDDIEKVTREKNIQRQRFNRGNNIDDLRGFREYGVNKRMKIESPGPRGDKKRRDGRRDGANSGSVGYADGITVDPTGTAAVPADSNTNEPTNPFGEVTPPSSEPVN